jgi:hypothetical protein
MDISLNGTTVQTGLDIYNEAGARYKALAKEYTVTADSAGKILVSLTATRDNALISAIEIFTGTTRVASADCGGITSGEIVVSPNDFSTSASTVLAARKGGTLSIYPARDTASWANQGAIVIDGGTFNTNRLAANTGTVTINRGNFQVTGDYVQNAGSTTLASGILDATGVVNFSGGLVDGTGTIKADTTNAATVSPGGPSSAGTLTIEGTYTQASSGKLNIEIGGETLLDVLQVTSSASLAGTLNVAMLGGYRVPTTGMQYEILRYGTRNGSFDTVNGLVQDNGLRFTIDYQAARMTLVSVVDDSAPPLLQTVTPSGLVNTNVSKLRAVFNEPIDPTTFRGSDVIINTPSGTVDQASITVMAINATDFEISFPGLTAEGAYSISIGPSISDTFGNAMRESKSSSFTIDKTGPKVISATPMGAINPPLTTFEITFDTPIVGSTLTTDDISLALPSGSKIAPYSITTLSSKAYRVAFNSQNAVGQYTLAVGPDIRDQAGNPMDQNSDGLNGQDPLDIFTSIVEMRSVDLIVSELKVAQTALKSGDFVTIQWVDLNNGTGATGGSWYDRVRVVNTTTGVTLINQDVWNSTSISAGGTLAREFSFNLPDGLAGVGTLSIEIIADVYANLFEYNSDGNAETNNKREISATSLLASYPDLQITELKVTPNTIVSGSNVLLQWKDANTGNKDTSGSWYDRVRVVNTTTGMTLINQDLWNATSIVSGGTLAREFSFNLPDGVDGAGTLSIEVIADVYGYVFEFNSNGNAETNNTASASATSTLAMYPDLQITDLTVTPTTALSGSNLRIQWKDSNRGNKDTNGLWYDRVRVVNTTTGVTLINQDLWNSTSISSGDTLAREFTFTLPDGTAGVGTLSIEVITDVYNYVFEFNGDGNAETNNTASTSATSTLAPYANLTATAVSAPATALPGSTINISWLITNTGTADVDGSWSDRIFLSTDAIPGAGDLFVGSSFFQGSLQAGSSVTRTAEISIPLFIQGDLRFAVETGINRNFYEVNTSDNVAIQSSPTSVAAALLLSLSRNSFYENEADRAATGWVSRNGDTTQVLVVTMATSNASVAGVPTTITIPAGAASAPFTITAVNDEVADGNNVVSITASAAGFSDASVLLTSLEDDVSQLTLSIAASSLDESTSNPATTGTITRNTATTSPLIVTLQSDTPSRATVPATVTIPAGATSVSFGISLVNNTDIDGSARVNLLASASGLAAASDSFVVNDDDFVNLALAFTTTTITEGQPSPAAIGTVARSVITAQPLVVTLTSANPSALAVPATVTIPANRASAQFAINAPDDVAALGTRNVLLTAQPTTTSGLVLPTGGASATLKVLDNDGPKLMLSASNISVREGTIVQGFVIRNTDTATDLLVSLASGDATEASVPATVIIPAGSDRVEFSILGLMDGQADGAQPATLTASANGYNPGSFTVIVTDADLPDLVVTSASVPAAAIAGATIELSWNVFNQGVVAATGSWIDRVFLSTDDQLGDDELIASIPFSGSVAIGGNYSRTQTITLPMSIGQFKILVVADGTSSAASGGATAGFLPEASETNNSRVAPTSIAISPAYRASARTIVDVSPLGAPVPIEGRAFDPSNDAPAANVPITIRVNVKGTRRIIHTTTDNDGKFSTAFEPLPMEAGQYTISADHPGIVADTGQDSFRIYGLNANFSGYRLGVVVETPETNQITLKNLGDLPLTGLAVEVIDAPTNLTVTTSSATTIPANGSIPFNITVSASSISPESGNPKLRITTIEGASFDFPLEVTVRPLAPQLLSTPGYLERGMLRGERTFVSFDVLNNGGGTAEKVEVFLPDVPWMKVVTPNSAQSIPVGGWMTVTLALTPQADLPLGKYTGTFGVNGSNGGVSIPFDFRAISDAVGDVVINVQDEYTFFVDGNPQVANARVILRDPFTNAVVAEATTGESGTVTFSNVREGTYTLEVTSTKHGTYKSSYTVLPGITNKADVFVQRQTVSYSWVVTPTEIEDNYSVRLETTFETNVPAPVVTLDLPDQMPILQPGESAQLEAIITNHGLIAAEGVAFTIPEYADYVITPLMSELGVLPAKSSIRVPLTIRAKTVGEMKSDAQLSANSAPLCTGVALGIRYLWFCGGGMQMGTAFKVMMFPVFAAACLADAILAPIATLLGGGSSSSGGGGGGGGIGYVSGGGLGIACPDYGSLSASLETALNEAVASRKARQADESDGAESNNQGWEPELPPVVNPNSDNGVCAKVRLQLDQQATLTRAAFNGALEINNGSQLGALTGVKVTLDFRDEAGNSVNDRFFVQPPRFTGLTAADGTGTLASNTRGSAQYTIIPTRTAASTAPTVYTVGGSIRYIDPDGGKEVVIPLTGATITVYPDPNLELDYFWQRDVIGDDPFTEEVEPSEPFALGILVTNSGKGNAKNFKIASSQPKIVENEKGLLIDFKIIGSQVGTLPVSPSLTVNFGNINAGETVVGQWLMESTLQGKFIDFTASFTHSDDLGGKATSLIDTVRIHELIRSVRVANPTDDSKPDFLVNDVPDADHLPDTLYFSGGGKAMVKIATDADSSGAVGSGSLTTTVSATMSSGWNYFNLIDPGAGYRISKITRSDGKELPAGSFWQTNRTFPASGSGAVRENRLHIIDKDGTGRYTVSYLIDDSIAPQVVDVVDLSPDPQAGGVHSIDVVFSEPIDLDTFTVADLTLTRDAGENLLNGSVSIAQVSTGTYRVSGLESLTGAIGVYEFTVIGANIKDFGGNSAIGTASDRWSVGDAPPFVQSFGTLANQRRNGLNSLDVTFSKPIAVGSFTFADVSLTRDGGNNLADNRLIVSSVSGSTWRISGLDSLTDTDGVYSLSVNAAGVTDLAGKAGIGSTSATWAKDGTSPSLTSVEEITTNPRNITIPSLRVTFSEPIDPATLTRSDITITRNGSPITIDDRVKIDPVSGSTYRISGFTWFIGLEGTYILTVSAEGISDLAGNLGVGSSNTGWVMDTTLPAAPTNLQIVPDTGVSNSDGLTKSKTVTLSGSLSEPGLSVRLVDTVTDKDLGYAEVVGTQFSKQVTVTASGKNRIQIRVVDSAGNVNREARLMQPGGYFDIFFDDIPPVVTGIGSGTSKIQTEPVSSLDVTMSEEIDIATFTWEDLSLTRNGGANLITSDVSITPVTGLVNTYRINGLSGLSASDGSYVLTVNAKTILDLAGNSGIEAKQVEWLMNGNGTVRLSNITGTAFHDYDGDGTFDADEQPMAGWTVFLDINANGKYDEGTDETALTDSRGQYIFSNLAAGNYRVGMVKQEGWARSLPTVTDGIYIASVTTAGTATGVDFGFYQPAEIRGTLYSDANSNGVQDAGEVGLEDWLVYLDKNANGVFDTTEPSTRTGKDGAYIFTGLAPGVYPVVNVPRAGWQQIFPGLGETPNSGSQVAGSTSSPADTFVIFDQRCQCVAGTPSSFAASVPTSNDNSRYVWADRDPSTPDVVDIWYDFRDQRGWANAITEVQIGLAERGMELWEEASSGAIRFLRNLTASSRDIVNIGVGDLAALGGTSGPRNVLGLGGAVFAPLSQGGLRYGVAWLDQAENWENTFGNGNIAKSFDFFSVVAHEIGHAIGVDHFDQGEALMNSIYRGERTTFTVLDSNGVRNLYSESRSDWSIGTGWTFHPMTLPGTHIVSVNSGSVTYSREFGILDLNRAPTAVSLNNTLPSIQENTSTTTRTKVADIVLTDDGFGTNTVTLTGPDASSFEVDGMTLYLKSGVTLDFEAKNRYEVAVRVTDATVVGSTPVVIGFALPVIDINEAPTSIELSKASVAENAAFDAVVGTFTTLDQDADSTFTYTIISNPGDNDHTAFRISGAQLLASTNLDFETKSSYSIRVRSTDHGGLFTEKTFTISVSDVPEVPYQNPINPFDVDNDRTVSPLDVLAIINLLNSVGPSIPTNQLPVSTPFVNVTGDNQIDPLDVLALINFINSRSSGGEGEGFTHFVGVFVPDSSTRSMVSGPSGSSFDRPDRRYPDTAFRLLGSPEGSNDVAQGVLASIIDVEEWIPPSEEEEGMRLINPDDFFADLGRE